MKNHLFQIILFQILIFTAAASSGTEWVTVSKILSNDDNAIIVRKNGEAYQIEKGVGCISLWRFEGKPVLLHSPGVFLGAGSKLIIPEIDQECRIWDSTYLGFWNNEPAVISRYSPTENEILYIQVSLQLLGYLNKENKKLPLRKVEKGYLDFQKSVNLSSGIFDQETILLLSVKIQNKFEGNKKGKELADQLFNLCLKFPKVSKKVPDCDDNHWIHSVTDGGKLIILEDGSIWQVDPVDIIYSMLWLPTEDIMICDESLMINVDNGEQIRVMKIK